MKRVLIISPYFPPGNAADMQRVRMSLPFYKKFGWEAEVVAVDPKYYDIVKDPLLLESVPSGIKIHYVEALPKKLTSKAGLGSIALRSLWFFQKKVNRLLKADHFDLIYFSTTQFPLCVLGAYWKKKWNIPYVIDMQDPWHSDYYRDKPKSERPSKYWFSYRLNKFLEPLAMNRVDGIISVSSAYIDTLKDRYERLKTVPAQIITFGYFKTDFEIAKKHSNTLKELLPGDHDIVKIVYIGRGGFDMQPALEKLFTAFGSLVQKQPIKFKRFRFYFFGTSYASAGTGVQTIYPVAENLGLSEFVIEHPDRVPFYQSLKTLSEADALVVPGSNDPTYTASKIFPYVLAGKPLLGIFNSQSSAFKILSEFTNANVQDLSVSDNLEIEKFFDQMISKAVFQFDKKKFIDFNAENMTKLQTDLFNEVCFKK